MGGQLDGIFLTGSLQHEFIILIVTSFICLWLINLSLSLHNPNGSATGSVVFAGITATTQPHTYALSRNSGSTNAWQFNTAVTVSVVNTIYIRWQYVISVPADFRRHLLGKTPINVFHCNIAKICFVGKLVIMQTFSYINQQIEYYLNNTINLSPLTPHIMPCYTHKMAIVSWHRFYDVTSPCVYFQAAASHQ